MGFTTSYWQKERWSRQAADTLTSYGRCWNPSLGNWDVNWRVGVLSEEQTPQVIVFSGRVSEEEEQKDRLLCAQARRSPSRPVELSFSRSPGCIVENMRVASGSKEETREAFQETTLQVLLVRLHGARPSLPSVNSRNKVSKGG